VALAAQGTCSATLTATDKPYVTSKTTVMKRRSSNGQKI